PASDRQEAGRPAWSARPRGPGWDREDDGQGRPGRAALTGRRGRVVEPQPGAGEHPAVPRAGWWARRLPGAAIDARPAGRSRPRASRPLRRPRSIVWFDRAGDI